MKSKKEYNYSQSFNDSISHVCFNKKNVVVNGSYSYKSIMYPSDIDLYEIVYGDVAEIANSYVNIVKNIEKNDTIFITDIKLGYVSDWDVIDDDFSEYDRNKYIKYAEELYDDGIISNEELSKCKHLLKKELEFQDWYNVKRQMRYGLIRWKPSDITNKKIQLRDKTYMSLSEALQCHSLFKMDTIALIDGRYTKMTIIYELRTKDNLRINKYRVDFKKNCLEEFNYYADTGAYYMACKRLFSFCLYVLKYSHEKQQKDHCIELVTYLQNIFNGQCGLLYSIITQIDVIIILMEKTNNIKYKKLLDREITQLANIYDIPILNNNEEFFMSKFQKEIDSKNLDLKDLIIFKNSMKLILNYETCKRLENIF